MIEFLTSRTIPIRVRTGMVNLVSATLHLYRQCPVCDGAFIRSKLGDRGRAHCIRHPVFGNVPDRRSIGNRRRGFILGIVNALLVGATLRLIEQSLSGARSIQLKDVTESFGHYFWDVIGVGFVLWLPTMLLDMGMQANPYGQFLLSAFLLLVFILLNPAPEVIYQVRHDSTLNVLRLPMSSCWSIGSSGSSPRDSHLAGGAFAERAAGVFFAVRPCRSGSGSRLLPDPLAARSPRSEGGYPTWVWILKGKGSSCSS